MLMLVKKPQIAAMRSSEQPQRRPSQATFGQGPRELWSTPPHFAPHVTVCGVPISR